MGEKNLWAKMGLIIVLVAMFAWRAYPPEKRLKPGIDLGGGHSLLFEIDDHNDKSSDLAERVMKVLKNRVDPQGTRNLVWRPIGRNRLEIQMPRPSKSKDQPRKAYDAIRDQLMATNITTAQVRDALAKPPAERAAAFEKLTGIIKSRKALFDRLVTVDEQYTQLGKRYESLGAAESQPAAASQPASSPESQPEREQIADQRDQVLKERRRIIEQDLMKTNLDVRVFADLLDLEKKSEARISGIKKVRDEHPDLAAVLPGQEKSYIDQMIEAHDAWSGAKGALEDPSDLMRLLRGAGELEFRILAERSPQNPEMIDSSKREYNESAAKYVRQLTEFGPRPRPGDNFAWFKLAKPDERGFSDPPYIIQEYAGAKYVLAYATPNDPDMCLPNDRSWALSGARPTSDEMGRNAVGFSLDTRGGEKFGRMTGANIKRPLCIFLDGEAISSATIQSKIYNSGQISGSFTPDYVMYLVNTLEAGALPARLKEVPLQIKSVGPSLGETNRHKGQQAVIVAFIATVAFMILYYSYNGFIANIALWMNLVITLGVMSFLQATFTLPGIAGIVLTLGMAVDANVLIYERMREELERGVSVRMAVKLGYEKAFSAIFDSNVTTIISAVILYWVGSEEIKGFGLTLGIGLCVSMFTALFVTRQYYNVMVPTSLNRDETRKAWLGTAITGLVCGAFLAVGYFFNSSPQERAESSLWAAGIFFLWVFGTAALLILSMWAMRILYHGTATQKLLVCICFPPFFLLRIWGWVCRQIHGESPNNEANRLPMLRLFGTPKIDWMGKYRKFWTFSATITLFGIIYLLFGWKTVTSDMMDIEFIGGTSVQVQLKPEHSKLKDEQLLEYIAGKNPNDPATSEGWLRHAADDLANAQVAAAGDFRYRVTVPGKYTNAQIEALLLPLPVFGRLVERGGISPTENGAIVQLDQNSDLVKKQLQDLGAAEQRVKKGASDYAREAAERLRTTARAQSVSEASATGDQRASFEIITTEPSKTLVAEALLASMGNILEVVRPVESTLVKVPDIAPDGIFPIKQDAGTLADVLGGTGTGMQESVATFKGGLAMVFDSLQPPQTEEMIKDRLREMRLQPDFESTSWRDFRVVGLTPAGGSAGAGGKPLFKKAAVLVNDPNLPYIAGGDNAQWKTEVAEKELVLAQAALASTRSLQRVTQFAPQVAKLASQKAVIAVILSMIAIAAYLWVRFGSLEFGLAGILGLFHDITLTISCLIISHYVFNTPIGKLLMLRDFKIDLTIIAALLTLVGYSINDTIVIFDRIRENRGRLATVSTSLINNSINQTLSRTILTVFTVFIVVLVLYVLGGEGIHGFAFCMLIGCFTGTYSTFGISCPLLAHPKAMAVVGIMVATLIGLMLVWMIPFAWVHVVLGSLVLLFAALGLYKQLGRPSAGPGRQPLAA